jgi:hypothetical protein
MKNERSLSATMIILPKKVPQKILFNDKYIKMIIRF